MIYLENIKFKKAIEFEVNREEHLNRKVRVEKVQKRQYERGKTEYKYFELIPADMSVDFSDITIIVGDNGIGKSTLLKTLKLPDFSRYSQKDVADLMKKYVNDGTRTLRYKKLPNGVLLLNDLHKSSVRKDIGDKIGFDAFMGIGNINDTANFLLSNDDSNGEALIDIYKGLDYKNTLIVLDEPETSLSLRSIGKLKEQIVSLSKDNQIVISTHHPYIMELCETIFDMESKKIIDTKDYLRNYR